MIWSDATQRWLYRATIINSRTEALMLYATDTYRVVALPVPGGKIVEFASTSRREDWQGRGPMYAVRVRMKGR